MRISSRLVLVGLLSLSVVPSALAQPLAPVYLAASNQRIIGPVLRMDANGALATVLVERGGRMFSLYVFPEAGPLGGGSQAEEVIYAQPGCVGASYVGAAVDRFQPLSPIAVILLNGEQTVFIGGDPVANVAFQSRRTDANGQCADEAGTRPMAYPVVDSFAFFAEYPRPHRLLFQDEATVAAPALSSTGLLLLVSALAATALFLVRRRAGSIGG